MIYTAEQLSIMDIEELERIHSSLNKPTQEEKNIALKNMDIGIYDSKGNLIGDKQMYEDGYDD